MKIVAFAASTSSSSINQQVVAHASRVFQNEIEPSAEIELLDLNDYEMPIYSVDREREAGIPAAAQIFFERLGAADALLISFAEHNGHYTAAFKNIFDWASRVDKKVFQGKPCLFMAASLGRSGGASVLRAARESAPFFGAELCGTLSIGQFAQHFDVEAGDLKDRDLAAMLREGLRRLHGAVLEGEVTALGRSGAAEPQHA